MAPVSVRAVRMERDMGPVWHRCAPRATTFASAGPHARVPLHERPQPPFRHHGGSETARRRPVRLGSDRSDPRPHRAPRAEPARLCLARSGVGAARGGAGRRNPQGGPAGRTAAWPAVRHQGRAGYRRHAVAIRLADLGRAPAAGGRGGGGAGAAGGGDRGRQDGDDRIRRAPSGSHHQSAQPGAHAGRLVLGFGGRRGGRVLPRGLRHADRRQHHPAGCLLRRRRLQAELRHLAPRRHEGDERVAGHDRRHRRQRRRLRAVHGGAHGARLRRAGSTSRRDAAPRPLPRPERRSGGTRNPGPP